MSFCKSFIFGMLALFTLSACQTLSTAEIYDKTQSQIDRIQITEAKTRYDQIFNRTLSDNLNQNVRLRDLRLNTTLSVSNSSTLSVKGQSSNLSKTQMSLQYELVDKVTGAVMMSGTISRLATSGTVSAYYAQDKSRQFAAERLTIQLADRLALRLRRHFLDTEGQ